MGHCIVEETIYDRIKKCHKYNGYIYERIGGSIFRDCDREEAEDVFQTCFICGSVIFELSDGTLHCNCCDD